MSRAPADQMNLRKSRTISGAVDSN